MERDVSVMADVVDLCSGHRAIRNVGFHEMGYFPPHHRREGRGEAKDEICKPAFRRRPK